MPAAPSCDIFTSLHASGAVKRLFHAAACQRPRQATFWRRCVPAAPSSDFLASLTTQRLRQATFWRRCVPAAPSSDFLASLCASGSARAT